MNRPAIDTSVALALRAVPCCVRPLDDGDLERSLRVVIVRHVVTKVAQHREDAVSVSFVRTEPNEAVSAAANERELLCCIVSALPISDLVFGDVTHYSSLPL